MTEKTSNKNGARGHPPGADQEKIQISQEARIERTARQKANLTDTAFRQAEKEDRFSAREDVFSGEDDVRKTSSEQLKARRSRLKRSYARDVRAELGQESSGGGRGGIRTRAAGRSTVSKGHFHTEESLKKDRAFFVGEERSKGRKAIRRFSGQRLSSAAENALIGQKDDMFYGGDDYNVSAEAVKKAKAAQKHLIRKNYQRAPESAVYIPIVSRIRERAKAHSGQVAAGGGKSAARKLAEFFEEHPVFVIAFLVISILVMLVGSSISGSTMLITHTVAPSALATTYTAEDDDITGAEEDYRVLEAELSSKVGNLERYYPGYSLYQLSAAQIGHDPFKLAALLTVLHEDYRREDVQDDLQRIFEAQYNLSLQEAPALEGGGGTFTAVLKNYGLDHVADKLLTKDEKERYDLLVETKGNKPDLFEDDIYANSGAGWFDYTVAGEALSDQKFANMMAEAKKYLGYPYVWGGSSPATSFDCSGFVCWVINHSGNGWNVGRTTANGLCNMLPKVKASEAKPGDIIFFQGTYATAGASHVGIYLGNNMMIHCGTPIQYANINTPYWQQHFYCFGRLP